MKFFRRNKNKQDPITYIKKERNQHFFFATNFKLPKLNFTEKTKKIFRRTALISLPIFAIVLGTTLGVITYLNNKQDQLVNQIIIDENVSKRRVYLISDDKFAIPLTVSLDKKNNIHEEMLDVINLLKISSKASNEYLHGFINDEAKVNSFYTDENNELTVDFSANCFVDDGIDKNIKIEALVSSLLQFNNVNSVKITINNSLLSNDSNPLLNKISTNLSNLANKELVTVFYQRNYDVNHQYLVPISLYAESGATDNITYVNGLFKTLPSKYMLSNLSIYDKISKNQSENNDFTLTVNSSALIDEKTVNKDLYDIVLLSLDLMGKEESVSFDIEGETLMVEGIYQEEDIEVGSIYYNEIDI